MSRACFSDLLGAWYTTTRQAALPVALLAAERGAHVMVADRDVKGAESVAEETRAIAGKEAGAIVWNVV